VAIVSFNALCAHSNSNQSDLDNDSRLKDFSFLVNIFVRRNVSKTIFEDKSIQAAIKKSLSKKVLCPKIGKSHINSVIFVCNSSIYGAFSTSSLNIFVIFDDNSGISIQGLTKLSKRSIISNVFGSNFTSANSIILSLFLSNHVVSKSRPIIINLKNLIENKISVGIITKITYKTKR